MELQKQKPIGLAGAKAGMSEKTARKYKNRTVLPSQSKPIHNWQTRIDSFKDKWEEVKGMLELNGGLEAKTLFKYLQKTNPGKFQDGQLRSLQRKIKHWRATKGPSKEVMFPQIHYPGDLAASDFTHMTSLGVTIRGESFDHMIYHFVLTYSNWETGTICFSESFESFSEGFQNAIWELGGVPRRHRSDNFSAAITTIGDKQEFTARYKSLLSNYNIQGEHIQSGTPHENGDSEQSHYQFKRAVAQSLMLRGSSDFTSREAYKKFLTQIFEQLNSGRETRFLEELDTIKRLPATRLEDFSSIKTKVGPSSTIPIKKKTYSVHSRLIREQIEVRLFAEKLEIWYGQKKVDEFPRLMGNKNHRINYRHIIDSLVRKPGAFENYRYREELFPTSRFRLTYDYFKKCYKNRSSKEYLKILHFAAYYSEEKVDQALKLLLSIEKAFGVEDVKKLASISDTVKPVDCGCVEIVNLNSYDKLISKQEETICH
ncbi:MAG: IS21 family transposase [Bacteroidota bacterium]|nr:IS21 family transposase [Bacteroidota bacterium]